MSALATLDALTPKLNLREPEIPADLAGSPRRARVWFLLSGLFAVLGLSGALAAGIVPRIEREQQLRASAAEASTKMPRVTVVRAQAMSSTEERVLPGNALPLLEAALYPRATGYIKSRLVDIGDRVQEGQLLAVIDAPDVDDQLAQAKADLAQTTANLAKAKAEAVYASSQEQRYRRMVLTNAVSQLDYEKTVQEAGVARAAVGAMEAAIKVNEANVQRLTDLQGFEKIIAPFPGVITARHVEQGDLVSANSTAVELFHLMRTDVLRVFVNVPQVFAGDVQVGQQAQIYRREDPRRSFTGTVTRTAEALDPATRTLLTEVQVPNPEGALQAGLYLQVKFQFQRRAPSVLVPAGALATRSNGPRLAILDEQGRVHYKTVQLGRDFGKEVEVVAGLDAGERVVVRPGDDLPEGTVVEMARPVAE